MNYAFLLASILLGVMGQIFMKWGVVSAKPLGNQYPAFLSQFLSWPVLAGLFFYGLSSVFWLFTLKKMDLSLAYPMVSLGYVLVLIAGSMVFHESIPPMRWFGMGVILAGVTIVSRT